MIVSLNWLKKYTDIDLPVNELATLIGARLVEIEDVINFGAKFGKALAVKVVEAKKLEGSDHLSYVRIDDGGVTDIERVDGETIQVVCGAPNIKTGQTVVWLPPESIVPETYGSDEPFILGIRKLCGVTSNGMIASAKELGLFEDHEGILELGGDIKPGTLFADAYDLNDYLLDIENKSLTHRPDCFGIIGFAREVAAIQGKTFETPDWLIQTSLDKNCSDKEVDLTATIDNDALSSRYLATVMSGADSKKHSPTEIQTLLARVGLRPINAVVDVTNYLMMLTGQPLHAFDYDKVVKVGGGKADIHVRSGYEGEKLELLDGKTIELSTEDIVIASGDVAIGLAGAMGGLNTAIDENTKRIIIESATFNLYKLRSTQMRHGIFSEAVTRFTKGQPAELSAPVIKMAIKLIGEWSGAKQISDIVEAYPNESDQISLNISADDVNQILGSSYSIDEIASVLQNVEFSVGKDESDRLSIKVPYWRADIHIKEDIAEEIGRLNGFDNIRFTLPKRDFMAVRPSAFDVFRNKVRDSLTRSGANEALSYSFIHGDVLKKAGLSVDNSYRIINSISPELQYYRQTLTPSLLSLIHPNVKQGYDNFALFEVNKIHQKQDGLNNEGVPVEHNSMALVFAKNSKMDGDAYYQVKRIADYLFKSINIEVKYERIVDTPDEAVFLPFENRRSARIINKRTDVLLGIIGEYKKSVQKGFKLPEFTAGFELDTEALMDATLDFGNNYKPLNRFPTTERDICFKVNKSTECGEIVDIIAGELRDLTMSTEVLPIDIYQPENAETKNITVRVKLAAFDHTLVGSEVSMVVDKLIAAVTSKIQASVI